MSAVPDYRYCPQCASALAWIAQLEDGGEKQRLRCPACGWTHWNNPTPVLAAVIQYQDRILLARNAAWTHKMYALITGFMEAGETPVLGGAPASSAIPLRFDIRINADRTLRIECTQITVPADQDQPDRRR